MSALSENNKRIELIDALRGFSVVLMVVHHLFFDLVEFLGAPMWLYTNPVFDFLHYVFAGLFVMLSGVSSRFSRNNVLRGIKVLAVASGITFVTFVMKVPIVFGILHLLGFSMVFYGLTRPLWDKIPQKAAMCVYSISIIATAAATHLLRFNSEYLWILGWPSDEFVSYDYFPILPWLLVFLLGTWAGKLIKGHSFPDWFYDTSVPVFPAIGRKSLLIYILHQPILYGFVLLIQKVFFR